MNETVRKDTGKTLAGLVLIIAAALVAYIPAMRAGFIWDDDAYVWNNQTLRSVDGLRQIWFKIGATPQYYPMVHTSYWLEYRLWKSNPAGYAAVGQFDRAITTAQKALELAIADGNDKLADRLRKELELYRQAKR